jgi:hypothetical protein
MNREGAKNAKGKRKLVKMGLNQIDDAFLRDLRVFAVKEVLP